jgi:hypothetical protein
MVVVSYRRTDELTQANYMEESASIYQHKLSYTDTLSDSGLVGFHQDLMNLIEM